MTLARGRVLRGAPSALVALPGAPSTPSPAGGRLPREAAEAHERAALVMRAAEQRALALLRAAEQRAAETRLRAEELGRADGLAEAARVLAGLHARQAALDARATDRIVELARLLTERLVGKALELDPSLVAAIARQVVDEARGARRITLVAHPEDAPLLLAVMRELDPDGRVHAVSEDPALARGDLRLETDVGAIEARLSPSLDRLAARLREALRP